MEAKSRFGEEMAMSPTVISQEKILCCFAESIFKKVRALKELNLNKAQAQRLNESISEDIKKASTFKTHKKSKAAEKLYKTRKKADKSGFELELEKQNWHTQSRFDGKNRREGQFHVEHKTPVSALRDECRKCDSVDGILNILNNNLVVVWITKEENERLDKNKSRTKRPDPDLAYKMAGIVICE
jgi:hypothetical protein